MTWDENLFIDGTRLDANIGELVTSAVLTRTMDGADSLEITLTDPDMEFLTSGILSRRGKPSTRQQQLKEAAWDRFAALQLTMDGVYFRFAGVTGNYDTMPWSITLTFESELATLMRNKTTPVKTSRSRAGREGFVYRLGLLSESQALNRRGLLTFTYVSPGPTKQAVAKVKDDDREKGINASAHLTINGNQINSEQRRNITISLTEAEKQNANERVFLAMLCAGIGESSFSAIPNAAGSDYGGVFQGKYKGDNPQFKISDTKGMAHYFLAGGKGFNGGGAIKLAASNADMEPGEIALRVEGSQSNFSSFQAGVQFYQQHLTEAKNILAAWGGASATITTRESYEFKAGGPKSGGGRENYWEASGRLADEVRWRRFATQNQLWFAPDEWFFKNRPAYVVSGKPTDGQSRMATLTDQGVLGLTFDADIGVPVSQITLNLQAARWTTGPGVVFEFEDCGPLTGRWLIWESRQDITAPVDTADVTLRRPEPAKKEPAPTTRTRTEDAPETGTPREAIIAAAKKALKYRPQYRYLQSRPFPDHLIPKRGETIRFDCSAFATLVYKTAGVPDPNGPTFKYNGFGNTQTLMAQGTRTSSPQPGDLVFYRSPEHVGVYVGSGKVIEMGGTPGPLEVDVHYRSDLIGYYTYDLTEQ